MHHLTLRTDASTTPLALTDINGDPSGYRLVLRASTPAPTPEYVKGGLDRTPTISRRLTRYKDCTYNRKMEEIMQGLWYEMAPRSFLDQFVPGHDAKPSQVRKIGGFHDLDLDYGSLEEASLYPVLVCVCLFERFGRRSFWLFSVAN